MCYNNTLLSMCYNNTLVSMCYNNTLVLPVPVPIPFSLTILQYLRNQNYLKSLGPQFLANFGEIIQINLF